MRRSLTRTTRSTINNLLGDVVDPIVESLIQDKSLHGGAVLLIGNKSGNLIHANSYGQLPDHLDTIYRAFSQTKLVTSVGAMRLVERNELDLNAPVSHYLPAFNRQNIKVYSSSSSSPSTLVPCAADLLVRDCMTHTAVAPLPSQALEKEHEELIASTDPYMPHLFKGNLSAACKVIANYPLSVQPGTEYSYGYGLDVISGVIEVITNRSFAEYLQTEVIVPLGMVDTTFALPRHKIPRLATLYMNGKAIPNKDEEFLRLMSFDSGGAGLFTTAPDYLRVLTMLLNNGQLVDGNARILKPTSVTQLLAPHLKQPGLFRASAMTPQQLHIMNHSLGAAINALPNGDLEHYWYGAASTSYWFCPARGIAVVAMANQLPLTSAIRDCTSTAIYDTCEQLH